MSYERNSFLSIENLQHLGSTIEGFLYDKYQLKLSEMLPIAEFESTVREVMARVDANSKGATLTEKNKQTILMVRDMLLQEKIPPEAPTHMPAPIERTATKSEEPEDQFMKKLQELEHKRKVPPTVLQQAQAPPPSPPMAPPVQAAAAPTVLAPAPAPVVVAVPPPPRQGITHIISSWDRNISSNPERAVLRWPTPLPVSSNPVGTSIAGVFLPASFSSYTPHISLVIEGAGGGMTSCLLAPDTQGARSIHGWQRWSPMNASLSYIRNVASPWVIQLRSADGNLIPLGIDHFQVRSMEVDISNRIATLHLSSILPSLPEIILTEADFKVGDHVWIHTKNDKKRTEVLAVKKDSIHVRYSTPVATSSMSTAIQEWMNGLVLNYHRQWSMVLDLSGPAAGTS